MENALANAQVIDVKEIPETGRVIFGSTVMVYDIENDKEIKYKIVGNLESNLEAGQISIDTPIAKGLVGKFVDDEINIQTPSGNLKYEILEVKTSLNKCIQTIGLIKLNKWDIGQEQFLN